jgi:hypothetical protein
MAIVNKTATQVALEEHRDVKNFAHKYSAYISESRQYRWRRPVPMLIDSKLEYVYDYYRDTYDEAFVEIHLPRDSFERLIIASEVHTADQEKVEHAMTVLSQHRADERVRDDNPAVQKAWLKYLTLLELARK